MKNFIKFILVFFITIMILFGVSTVVPKIVDIYKNKPVEKVDTVFYTDTLYFERTTTDTLPEYRYETIVKYDTLYKWKAKGDSIEKIPVRYELKKKLPVIHYPWGTIH